MNTSKIDKTILAFDAAMTGLSVGVIANNGHIVSRQIETQRAQASLKQSVRSFTRSIFMVSIRAIPIIEGLYPPPSAPMQMRL